MKSLNISIPALAIAAIACSPAKLQDNTSISYGLKGNVKSVAVSSFRNAGDGQYEKVRTTDDGAMYFDETGLKTDEITSDGRHEVFHYDGLLLTGFETFYADTVLMGQTVFTYTDDGKVETETDYYGKDSLLYYCQYTYDGKKMTEQIFSPSDEVIAGTEGTLDRSGRMLSARQYYTEAESETVMEWNYRRNGTLKSTVVKNEYEGSGTQTVTTLFDRLGNMESYDVTYTEDFDRPDYSETYRYDLDGQKNWTVKYVYLKDSEEPVGKIVRDIVYY